MITFLFSMLQAAENTVNTVQTATQIPQFGAMQTLMKFLPFILIALVFYFFIIRPQNQQRKKLNEMINKLMPGDRIITKGGIIGTINETTENSFIIELIDGTRMEILKHAVISIINDSKQQQ